SWPRLLRRDPEATSEHLTEARQICDEYGFHEVAGWVKQFDGWSQFWLGKRALGLAHMENAIQTLNTFGSFTMSPHRFVLLAEMHLESGNFEAAETLVKEAIETLLMTKEGWCEAEVYRITAEVMLSKPDSNPAAAEAYLRKANEVAKRQSAKW